DLAVTALEDPLQHAAIFAVPRPQELVIFVLPEPVDIVNLRQLGWIGMPADLEPVRKVITHVVTAEGEHGHGIATELADFARRRGRGLAAGGRAEESAVLPVESFDDQRDNAPAPAAEKDRVDGYALRILPLRSDNRALPG